MGSLFGPVLDDDEDLIKVYKPNRTKFFFLNILTMTLLFLVFLTISICAILFPEDGSKGNPIYILIPIGIFLVFIILYIVFIILYYNNLYYAYTDKRLIIRSGVFGVDYKTLDLDMIGAVDVSVSLIDKMLKKNTGSIRFGSMASPINTTNATPYKFAHVIDPYETCKKIKAVIDNHKKSEEDKKSKDKKENKKQNKTKKIKK